MTYAKIKDDPSLKRDLRNGALIGTPEHLDSYRKKKARILKERDRDREILEMKNEVSDLRQLVGELLTNLKELG